MDVTALGMVALGCLRDEGERPLHRLQVRPLPRLDTNDFELLQLFSRYVKAVLLDEAVEQVIGRVSGAQPDEREHVREVEVPPQLVRVAPAVMYAPAIAQQSTSAFRPLFASRYCA